MTTRSRTARRTFLGGSSLAAALAWMGFSPQKAGATGEDKPAPEAEVDRKFAEIRQREGHIDVPEGSGRLFVPALRAGEFLFFSGSGPRKGRQFVYLGKVGRDFSVEQGAEAAKLIALNMLQTAQRELGSLSRVQQVVEVFGMVNSAPGFSGQSQVMNGFSNMLVEVFGDAGRHTRCAVGMAELPLNFSVEIKMTLLVQD